MVLNGWLLFLTTQNAPVSCAGVSGGLLSWGDSALATSRDLLILCCTIPGVVISARSKWPSGMYIKCYQSKVLFAFSNICCPFEQVLITYGKGELSSHGVIWFLCWIQLCFSGFWYLSLKTPIVGWSGITAFESIICILVKGSAPYQGSCWSFPPSRQQLASWLPCCPGHCSSAQSCLTLYLPWLHPLPTMASQHCTAALTLSSVTPLQHFNTS